MKVSPLQRGNESVTIAQQQLQAAKTLSARLQLLSFSGVTVYDPLQYAFAPFKEYTERFGNSAKRILFLGMNPGPWGMAQTGIPFGEVQTVKKWLQISAPIQKPAHMHPKRPIQGYECSRSEVSGARLWGLFKERFATPHSFFAEHLVINYCPLLFIQDTPTGARNLTPDKLNREERDALYLACDDYLRDLTAALNPTYLVGVGNFAAQRAENALGDSVQIARILHPSPASPKSNGGQWGQIATQQLQERSIW